MPGKPIYKPKKPLLDRLQAEHANFKKSSNIAKRNIKNDLRSKITGKIGVRKHLEDIKTRYVLAREIVKPNLGKKEEIIKRLIDELGAKINDYRFKGTHIKQIKQLNKEINYLIIDAKVHNASYFQKIEKEYTTNMITVIDNVLNNLAKKSTHNLQFMVKYLEAVKQEILKAKSRQADRNDYFK